MNDLRDYTTTIYLVNWVDTDYDSVTGAGGDYSYFLKGFRSKKSAEAFKNNLLNLVQSVEDTAENCGFESKEYLQKHDEVNAYCKIHCKDHHGFLTVWHFKDCLKIEEITIEN